MRRHSRSRIRSPGRRCHHIYSPSPTDSRKRFNGTFVTCIEEANGSAAALVNIIVDNFPCLDDRHRFEDVTVKFHKRAQILVADLWACFESESYGYFHDINTITMFAGNLNPLLYEHSRSSHCCRLPHSSDAAFPWLSSV